MQPLPKHTEYSVFVDTSAIFSNTDCVAPLPDFAPTLTRVSFYISSLAVEERAVQVIGDIAELRKKVNSWGRFGVSGSFDCARDIVFIRAKIVEILKSSLKHSTLEVFEPIPHDIEMQRVLFEGRHRGAYKDALLFGSAVQLAASRGLKNCLFLAKDKGFSDLVKLLAPQGHFELQTVSELRERLLFDQSVYEKVVTLLLPQFRKLVGDLRAELVSRGAADRSVFGPIGLDAQDLFAQPDLDFDTIGFEVRDLSVRGFRSTIGEDTAFAANSMGYRPSEVRCGMTVRFSTSNWARLYQAQGQATLRYVEDKLSSATATSVALEWRPFA